MICFRLGLESKEHMQPNKNTCSQGGTFQLKDFKECRGYIVLRRRGPSGTIPVSEVTEAALPGMNLSGKLDPGDLCCTVTRAS